MVDIIQEDYKIFGKQFVYCFQHLSVHETNWCSVSVDDKVGLGVNTKEEGIEKCRKLGLPLFIDKQGNK